ncbi:MAG TPA: triphosphoribosyl-dephospho-CoA synthase MdcB [Dongiaceae bacterium]
MTTARALGGRRSPAPSRPGKRRLLGSAIAAMAARALLLELETWPKPGLVSHVDSGSHADMDATTFRASAAAIEPYLGALAEAGAEGCGMGRLRVIGREAEAAMLAATGGINTHRGAIFGLGLLSAAAGAKAGGRIARGMPLGAAVAALWGASILDDRIESLSHGDGVRRRYGAGGARLEAARGFPSVHGIGLPALRRGIQLLPGDPEAARVEACFALIASVEDTNLLHRGGPAGLRFAHCAAREFLGDGGVGQPGWRERARSIHESFVARRLSPGGAADLLAMSLFVEAFEEFSP